MKKLKLNDLTPELLKEVIELTTAKEVVAFFAAKDYEVSENAAQKILDHLKAQSKELSVDELDKVAGGCGGSSPEYTQYVIIGQ